MRSLLRILKHVAFGVHNIPKILFGTSRLTDMEMRRNILSNSIPPLVTVDEDLCLGCGVCSHICPTKAITMRPLEERIELTDKRFKEKVPEIDHMKCVYCFQCHDNCPTFTLHKIAGSIHPRGVKVTGVKARDLFKRADGDSNA
ncbi:MAG: 4Fe-4S binding protein [Candidatus Altiarchaeota archaeon]